MNFPWMRVATIAADVVSAVVTAVPIVESLARTCGPLSGGLKSSTVMDVVRADLAAAERRCGWSVANNPLVLKAVQDVIAAVVELHNVLAKSTVTPG